MTSGTPPARKTRIVGWCIGLGVFGFVAMMGAQNRWREIHPLMYGLVVLFGLYFANGWLSSHVF